VTELQEEPASDRPRAAISSRSLLEVALVAACGVALAVWVIYRQFIHYERRAVEHLPGQVQFVARLDVEKVPVFEPVRRYLLPLIDKLPILPASAGHPGREPGLLTRLRTGAGLNLGLDLREILVASTPAKGWVLVLGGLFPSQGLVAAIEGALRGQGVTGVVRQGDTLLFTPSGIELAQAADGCLLVASTRDLLASALPATLYFAELDLPRTGTGALFANAEAIEHGFEHADAEGDWLGKLQSLGVALRLGADLQLEARLDVRSPQEVQPVVVGFERWQQSRQLGAPSIPQADWGGERAVLARLKLVKTSGNTVFLTSSWQRPEFDRALRSLASWLERELASARPSPN
jgi:hypothetical protein